MNTSSVPIAEPERANLPDPHAAHRAPWSLVWAVALSALFLYGLKFPSVSTAVGVRPAQAAWAVGVFLVALLLASVSYYRFGSDSRAYRVTNGLETVVLSSAILYMIHVSGTALSFFWLFYFVHLCMMALLGESLMYALLVGLGPAALATLFGLRGDSLSVWLSALAGVLGLFLHINLFALQRDYRQALRREAQLRAELARISVAHERARISRDLHDNVATELTALIWKVREISGAARQGPAKSEMDHVAERLAQVIGDLRNVVLSLRGPELAWEELLQSLERRCRELCGSIVFECSMSGGLEPSELPAFRDGVLPVCLELVHNAAVHSGASRIQLRLQTDPLLELRVNDDGSGLSEQVWLGSRRGLRGARYRIEQLGGSVRLQPCERGTSFIIDVPRPLAG